MGVIKFLKRNRLFHHLVFWVLAFIVLLRLFSSEENVVKVDYIYTIVFLVSLAIPVYLNRYVNIPFLLNRQKYLVFLLVFIFLVLLGALFNEYIYSHLVDFILPGYYFISYYSYVEIFLFFLIFVGLTTFLKLSKDRFEQLEIHAKLAQIEKEKSLAELNSLKAHINPHFLFNSLNIIYSLVQKSPKKASDAIIQLSDILRFAIYDSSLFSVSIEKEVKLIEDYIALQKFRIEKSVDVQFTAKINNKAAIAPLLFLPLVENCFKHGLQDTEKAFIHIDVEVNEKKINFRTQNLLPKHHNEKDKSTGSGIDNVKSRLKLLYPGKHFFESKPEKHIFKTQITIPNEVPVFDNR